MSEVAEYYNGRSLLVTGAYGFMGKVLLEKLLYACPSLANIYILVRPKRGKSIELRLEEMLKIPIGEIFRWKSPSSLVIFEYRLTMMNFSIERSLQSWNNLFDRLRKERPSALKKIIPIHADLSVDDLGMTEESLKRISDVSVIYHAAASLRLDAKLKDSVKMNLEGTYRLLEYCKQLKKLVAFVYVSTAFCHCELEVMEERIYEPPVQPADIIRLCQWMDDDSLTSITSKIMGVHPNAYTYTKRLAEALINSYYGQLPVIVARPSIVTAAWKDPMPGWVDNLNGPVGLIVGGGKGVIRTMLCNAEYHAEVIPVDIAINGLITIPWRLRETSDVMPYSKLKETPVFNLTQSGTNPITWAEVLEMGKKATHDNPFQVMLWYPNGQIRTNRMVHNLCLIFYHWLPAYLIDFLLLIFGKKRFMINVQRRIQDGLNVLQYFTMREWIFKNDNLMNIRESMNHTDRELFTLDFEKIDAFKYISTCVLGARQYLLKEDPKTLPRARNILKIFYCLDCMSSVAFYILIAWLLVSCSDTAKYILDSATDVIFALPFVRSLK